MSILNDTTPRLTRHVSDHHAVQGEAEYVERHAPVTASHTPPKEASMSAAEMPERIWYHSDGAYLPYQPTMHWEWQEFIRSDLCASGQQVRALEWKDLGEGKSFRALLPIIGSVRVEPYGCCGWWEVLWSMPGQCDKLIPDVFDNPDDAKAAAQADYERRILAALTPAPQPEGCSDEH
ncbi:hypothetical protein [uncultured Paracoccus sp.]|uniref:hypothetical protein n=1 Tax=uncultured Paracoccus sp. TaxID=189685 RepID=UPI002597E59C|nr:hypothetical protein [uncultured Paracoccus sp.]